MTNKVLVVTSHPLSAKESTTLQLLNVFLAEYKKNNPNDEIEYVDTFTHDIPQIDASMFEIWSTDKNDLTEEQKEKLAKWNECVEQFLNSDKIILANPQHNLSFPAPFKYWMDSIMQAGKTFKYTENGPVGLVEGKKVLHLQSNGSVWNGQDLATMYIDNAFKFMNVDDVTHIYIDGKDIPDLREKAIENAFNEAKSLAKEF